MGAVDQLKWFTLLTLNEKASLKILTPSVLQGRFGRRQRERCVGFDEKVVPTIRTYFRLTHMQYMLDPFQVAGILRDFQPDWIHIEEDPYSVAGFEAVVLARIFARDAKISFFLWDNLNRRPSGVKGWLKHLLNRFALGRADLVVCGNREARRLLHEEKGYAGRSVVLPQLGLTAARYLGGVNFKLRSDLGVPKRTALIGYVGRLLPEKGIETLLLALERLPQLDWSVLLLGTGPLQIKVQSVWLNRLPRRIIMPGAVPREEVANYMRALDILVLPSLSTPTWVEQFGIVLAEAMLAGVPCVGSSSGAIPEVIGPAGIIFREGNVEELSDKLAQLIASPDLRRDLGSAAREFASSHYTNEVVADAYWKEFCAASVQNVSSDLANHRA